MANILLNLEKGIQVAASDILKFVAKANSELKVTPQVVAAIGVLLGALATAASNTAAAAQAGALNITLDEADVNSLKAVWPDLVAFATTLGIKL